MLYELTAALHHSKVGGETDKALKKRIPPGKREMYLFEVTVKKAT